MADLSFLYIAFFLTIGSFLLGFVTSWNLKSVFDQWKERAEYAAVVMLSLIHISEPTRRS